jgi:type IV secretory pathway VirB10-like protein
VEDVLADEFAARGYSPDLAPMYSQMLVGMVALTGQWWLDVRKPGREEVAAHVVNLAWNGLTGLNPQPAMTMATRDQAAAKVPAPRTSDKELRELDKVRERELKEAEKIRQRELREAEKARVRELREREKLLKEAEKERERLLKEAEKAREREEKLRQREARLTERAARLGHADQLE